MFRCCQTSGGLNLKFQISNSREVSHLGRRPAPHISQMPSARRRINHQSRAALLAAPSTNFRAAGKSRNRIKPNTNKTPTRSTQAICRRFRFSGSSSMPAIAIKETNPPQPVFRPAVGEDHDYGRCNSGKAISMLVPSPSPPPTTAGELPSQASTICSLMKLGFSRSALPRI